MSVNLQMNQNRCKIKIFKSGFLLESGICGEEVGLNEFSRSYDTKGLDIVVWGGRRELWRNDGRLFGESVAGESAIGKNENRR